MNNRLLRLQYGAVSEAYHLFHLVQLGRKTYALYATRAESDYIKIARVRKGLGSWKLRECSEGALLLEDDLRPFLTRCEPLPTYTAWQKDRETGEMLFLEERDRPFAVKEQGWTLPGLLAWLSVVTAAGWVALNRLNLRDWVLAVVQPLSRAQAELLVRLALPLLSLGYLLLCAPSLKGVLYSVAFGLSVLVLPAVWKLHSPELTLSLCGLLLAGLVLCGSTLWQSRKLRLPSRRRQERQQAFELLGICMVGVTVLCYGWILPQVDPPPLLVSTQQTQSVEQQTETAEEAHDRYRSEVIPQLTEARWQALTLQQRVDLLQQVVDYEAEWNLHCSALPVQIRVTERATTLAYYDGTAINIDRDNLQNRAPELVLQSALHELRHHYQYQVAAMLQAVETELPEFAALAYFDAARQYADNIEEYVSSAEDPEGYYYQVMEQDARGFAKNRYEGYYQKAIELAELLEREP